jgi:hypothetical protein
MPHHAHSIDRWDDATGSNLYEHLAGVNDSPARATFAAAVKRWPGAKITLRNSARIIARPFGCFFSSNNDGTEAEAANVRGGSHKKPPAGEFLRAGGSATRCHSIQSALAT